MTDNSFEPAADAYVLACVDLIQQWQDSAGALIDSTAADRALLEASGAELGRPIVDAAHAVFADCARYTERVNRGRGASYDDVIARSHQLKLSRVVQAADAVLTSLKFAEQGDLDTAEADLTTARQQLADRRADLEAAVNRGDLGAVMDFRHEVELQLPARIGELTSVVLGLRTRRAEAAQVSPQGRLERAAAAVASLEVERQELQRRLYDELPVQQGRARLLTELATAAASNAEQAHDALVGERDLHRDLAAQQRQDAVRRLAGLPTAEVEQAPTPEPERPAVPGFDVRDPSFTRRVGQRVGA